MSDLRDSLQSLGPGSRIWYKQNSTSWTAGQLVAVPSGTECEIALEGGERFAVPIDAVQPANPEALNDNPDLCQLSYLNEPSILHNLAARFGEKTIYTFAGPVLIAVNPCEPVDLYGPEIASRYQQPHDLMYGPTKKKADPHIYSIAADAFKAMVRDKASQSLVVSGESGAGKTETTKKAMQYFTTLAGGGGVEDKVLETNPILEAFGNAKTLRNHNSSRFGKLLLIHFNHSHHICGAGIKTYLLEKSRVSHQLKGERSYHIFYQLIKGATAAEREAYLLPADVHDFNYLNQSLCTEVPGMDDKEEFRLLKRSLTDVGFTQEQQAHIFSLVAAVLWLGNMQLEESGESVVVTDDGRQALSNAAQLLGVSEDQLEQAVTKKVISTRGEELVKNNSMAEATEARDSLAKVVYASLFSWIVEQLNMRLAVGNKSSGLTISVLDIFGFEDFDHNSFEQLCINYTNERLQHLFNRHIFTLQLEEYRAEGILDIDVEFEDNQDRVDLLEVAPPKGVGVLALMDAQSKMPRASDDGLLQELKKLGGGQEAFARNIRFDPRKPRHFSVHHYAGEVFYNTQGMLDKNKDTINPDLLRLMTGSSHPLLAELGASREGDRDGGQSSSKKAKQSVGVRFAAQLKELIGGLDGTGLHFVRCIKPNSQLKPGMWTADMVLQQLRCCGVLEVVRMARKGYPSRCALDKFADRYSVMLPGREGVRPGETVRQAVDRLLSEFQMSPSQYLIGNTKVFFRPGVLGQVEDQWATWSRLALRIQTNCRCWQWRTWFNNLRRAAITFQSGLRGLQARREYAETLRRDRAARLIQRCWQSHHYRQKFLAIKRAVMVMQMGMRRWKVARNIRRRQYARERAELMAQLARDEEERRLADEAMQRHQQSYEAIKDTYGVSVDEVRAAVEAYIAAGRDTGKMAVPPVDGAEYPSMAPLSSDSAPGSDLAAGQQLWEGAVTRQEEERVAKEKAEAALAQYKFQSVVLKQALHLNRGLRERYLDSSAQKDTIIDEQRVVLQKQKNQISAYKGFISQVLELYGDRPDFPDVTELLDEDETRSFADIKKQFLEGKKPLQPRKIKKVHAAQELQAVQDGIESRLVGSIKDDLTEMSSRMEDSLDFIVSVAHGNQEGVALDPYYSLGTLRRQFHMWTEEFGSRLSHTQGMLSALAQGSMSSQATGGSSLVKSMASMYQVGDKSPGLPQSNTLRRW